MFSSPSYNKNLFIYIRTTKNLIQPGVKPTVLSHVPITAYPAPILSPPPLLTPSSPIFTPKCPFSVVHCSPLHKSFFFFSLGFLPLLSLGLLLFWNPVRPSFTSCVNARLTGPFIHCNNRYVPCLF